MVPLDFLWGLYGVEKYVMESSIQFAAVNARNEGVKASGVASPDRRIAPASRQA
jgi:hypothetical protein